MKPILVFQTDFTYKEGAVSSMYGVVKCVDRELEIMDGTHELPQYDTWSASYRLYQSLPFWPEGTIYVSVVDPGVGTSRRACVAKTKSGHYVVSPDNGSLTHVKRFIGIEAVRAGREVRFMDCARLVEDLADAQARGILKKRLKYYAHSKPLLIDELGYLDIGEGGADLLFQLISTRCERRSTIITTNVGIGGWGKVFGDDVAASAIADRVCNHCHVIKITGRSYRLKDLPCERRGAG